MQKLIGLNRHFDELTKLLRADLFPKVSMISGKKGIGKFTLIHHILSNYFDKENYIEKENQINKNSKLFISPKETSYLNIMYFSGEDNLIKIDNIRNLRTVLQKSTIDNQIRFIIFDDIELFNINCCNALLKIIEEPTIFNNFILINNKNKPVLETIRSRCIEFKIFTNQNENIQVIEKLISSNQIECKINFKKTNLTPGDFLKFNNICLNDKINYEDGLLKNIDKLFKNYQKKRNYNYLNFAIFLVNQHFYDRYKNETFKDEFLQDRTEIIKKIVNLNNINLNTSNIFYQIEQIVK